MNQLSHHEVVVLLLSLAVLLGAARLLGELARRLHQPAVIGEILAGILLGPTVLGGALPGVSAWLFPHEGNLPVVLHGLTTIAITLFLLVAGMEVDISTVWRQGRAASLVSVGGIAVPFAVGLGSAWLLPRVLGWEPGADRLVFALFFATAMAISALPVIAKTLMDLKLYRTDLGMVIIAAAICDDLTGWIIFAVILGMMSSAGGDGASHAPSVAGAIWMTLTFAALMLTLGRWVIHRVLPYLQAHLSWPGGVLGVAITAALLCAAFTEWIGVHAIFGAFIFGVALGDSRHLHARTRETIDQFVSFIFAPLFFASIGLRVDFVEHFDALLVLLVLVIATVGKIGGCFTAAKWAGFRSRDSWAIGFGMNSRGAMEIILGLLALEAGLIGERLFVALVVMALVTSVTSGAIMGRILGHPKPVRFWNHAGPKTFVESLTARDRRAAIEELALTLGESGLDPEAVGAAAVARDRLIGSGIGNGVAVPHARLPGITAPVVAVGRSAEGIEFRAPDREPVRLIVLLVTPTGDPETQLHLLASVAEVCQHPETVAKLVAAASWTEFLAVLNAAPAAQA